MSPTAPRCPFDRLHREPSATPVDDCKRIRDSLPHNLRPRINKPLYNSSSRQAHSRVNKVAANRSKKVAAIPKSARAMKKRSPSAPIKEGQRRRSTRLATPPSPPVFLKLDDDDTIVVANPSSKAARRQSVTKNESGLPTPESSQQFIGHFIGDKKVGDDSPDHAVMEDSLESLLATIEDDEDEIESDVTSWSGLEEEDGYIDNHVLPSECEAPIVQVPAITQAQAENIMNDTSTDAAGPSSRVNNLRRSPRNHTSTPSSPKAPSSRFSNEQALRNTVRAQSSTLACAQETITESRRNSVKLQSRLDEAIRHNLDQLATITIVRSQLSASRDDWLETRRQLIVARGEIHAARRGRYRMSTVLMTTWAAVVAFVGWTWMNGRDVAYIRQRRMEVFGSR